VKGFVVGNWADVASGDSSAEVIEAIVAARTRLRSLQALFIGDIVLEEAEISWIHQDDMAPVLSAYPGLTHFQVRGGGGLSLGALRHASLRTLIVETGGLDVSVVRQVAAADLPKLEHLELWLGSGNYGANFTLEDLAPILSGERFPALKTLALRDSEEADAVAKAVAASPLLERIQVLDLSMGNLGDDGAQALVACPAVKRLKRLDLRHNYMSAEALTAVEGLGIPVDVSENEPDADPDDRYIAISE
jgi:hypothetical protein